MEQVGAGRGFPGCWGGSSVEGQGWTGILAHPSSLTHLLQAARANLEKAQSELSGAADEAARAEIQIRIEANEALVKALE